MPQKFGLYEDLSVRENFRLYAEIHGVSTQQRDQRYEQLMQYDRFRTLCGAFGGQLSGGMKQKTRFSVYLGAFTGFIVVG